MSQNTRTHWRSLEMVERTGKLDCACGAKNVRYPWAHNDPEFVTCPECKVLADAEVVIRHTKQLKARRWMP